MKKEVVHKIVVHNFVNLVEKSNKMRRMRDLYVRCNERC